MTLQQNLIRCGLLAALVGLLFIATAPAHAGTLLAWGANWYGQLGNGTNTGSNIPVAVTGLGSDVTAIAGEGDYSLAIQNGTAKAWGWNGDGQLGNGTNTASNVPVAVTGLGSGVTAIAAGDYYSTDNSHSLAIQNGAAKAWGYNGAGELGNGTYAHTNIPVAVTGLESNVIAIAAGAHHSLAIQNGAAKAWGNNFEGELGNGTNTDSNVPVAVTGLGSGVTAIAAGDFHSLAIHNGAAKAWGYNWEGQLGNGTNADSTVPVAVTGLTSGVTAIAAGNYHSLAIQGGDVYTWGVNGSGQLGNGTNTASNIPLQVLDLEVDLIDVAAGFFSSYALSADGSLWVWGANSNGELGLGDNATRLVPTQLFAPEGYRFTAIAAGDYHALAIIEPVAVPEPSTLALFVFGGVGLVALRR